MRNRWLLIVSGAVGLLIFWAALVVDWGASVVVSEADERVVSRFLLPDSGSFGIEYIHSYYGAPVDEQFSANPQGGFELVEVSSPSEAVLDYYELEGHKATDDEWMRLVPREPRRFEVLSLVGTATGQKTLVLPDRKVPLFAENGTPIHLTLWVEKNTFFTEMLGGLRP